MELLVAPTAGLPFIWRNQTASKVPLSLVLNQVLTQTHRHQTWPVHMSHPKSFKPCLAAPACNRRRQDKSPGAPQCLTHAGPFSMETTPQPSAGVEITYVGNLCGFFEGRAFPREEKERERGNERVDFPYAVCATFPPWARWPIFTESVSSLKGKNVAL